MAVEILVTVERYPPSRDALTAAAAPRGGHGDLPFGLGRRAPVRPTTIEDPRPAPDDVRVTLAPEQFDALSDAAFAVAEESGTIVAWNREATRLTGWTADDACGHRCSALLEGVDRNAGAVCQVPCPYLGNPAEPVIAVTGRPVGRAGWSAPVQSAGPLPAHPDMLVRTAKGTRLSVVATSLRAAVGTTAVVIHLMRGNASTERDPLTDALTRDGFLSRLLDEQRRSRRLAEPLSLAMVDVDHLKAVNDSAGHAAGDAVLLAVARHLREGRHEDLVGRWGGDEFTLLLPGAGADAAALRLRRTLARLRRSTLVAGRTVAYSAGVTDVASSEPWELAMQRADAALYDAKRSGRGRVSIRHADPGA